MKKLASLITAALVLLIITTVICTSCGVKSIGSGIILWSPDEQKVQSGSLVPVLAESEIEDTFTISIGEDETIDLPKWRIQFFDKRKEAERYRETHFDYLQKVAIAKIDSLAVRETAEPAARRVYKLRQYEVIKIIDKTDKKFKVGSYEDFWYNVLTMDGTEGWCYGESLIIKNIGEELDEAQDTDIHDPELSNFLQSVWRPEYFRTYIDDNTIDLEEFRADIGIFPQPVEKTIRHVTKRKATEYTYTEIVDAGQNLYLFKGTPLQVKVYTPERIMFEYLENGKSVQKLYLKIEENIDELVQQEQERRWELYDSLTEKGNVFTSEAYGTIEFINYTKFRWTDYNRLVPDVIPPHIEEKSGKLEFSLFLDDSLKSKYDGALLLIFTEKKEAPIALLFTKTAEGVRFVYAPSSTRTGTVIKREPAAPIIMFFSLQGE